MNPVIFNETITEDTMMDFIHQIMDIFRLSNYQKYILFSLKVEKDDCIIRMSILNHDGVNQQYENIHMNASDSYFPSFLVNLVQAFREHCDIIREDIVNLDQDSFVALRMITEFNDLITLDGLEEDVAKELLKQE